MGVGTFVNRRQQLLRSLNLDSHMGVVLAAGAVALLLLTLAGDAGRRLLRYDRARLAAGEWWRLISAHLVHLDVRHALVNIAGLALLWALFARDYSPRQWLAILLGAMAAIDAGLWLSDSTVEWYVGSSGVLHGVLAAGTLAKLRRGERDGWILAAFLAGKLAYEHWVGQLPFSGSAVVVSAHLYGVLGGATVAAGLRPTRAPL